MSGEPLRWVDRDGDGFEDEIASGAHELELTGVFLEHLTRAQRDGRVFLDVGAHVGRYTVRAAHRGARVVAVEPFPPSRAGLRSNLDLNGLLDLVTIIPEAAWDERTRVRLGIPRAADGQLLPPVPGHGCVRACDRAEDVVEVDAAPLDETVPAALGNVPVGFVKVDVEGAEGRALRGAMAILAADRPVVLMELHHRYYGDAILDDVLGTLNRAGYGWTMLGAIQGSDYLLARPR